MMLAVGRLDDHIVVKTCPVETDRGAESGEPGTDDQCLDLGLRQVRGGTGFSRR